MATTTETDIVLLDFRADWCGACRLIEPVLDRIEAADPHLVLEKIDVGEAPEKAAGLNVTRLPTLIFQDRNGRELQRLAGPLSGRQIESALVAARAQL